MKKYTLLFAIVLLFMGCGLESKYGLPEELPTNPDLVGVWKDVDNGKGMILITKKSKTRYTLEVVFDLNKNDENFKFEAYDVKIGNQIILNLLQKDNNGQNINMFYTYNVKRDTLTFKEVVDNTSEIDKESASALLNYFKNNIDKKDFFGESIRMVRLK